MDPQNSTKTKHTNQHEHSIQLSKTNPTFNSHEGHMEPNFPNEFKEFKEYEQKN